jgi:hypothetical protein
MKEFRESLPCGAIDARYSSYTLGGDGGGVLRS